jgi:DNA methylase/Methyltransferase domain
VAGTSGRGVQQFKRVVEAAPELAAKVRAGTLPLDRAERILRDRQAEERKVAETKNAARRSARRLRVEVRHGDLREVLDDVPDGSVDAVITDPPYSAEHLDLYEDLGKLADRVLTPDGVLAVLCGQTWLPAVFHLLGDGRPYRWTCAVLTEGPGWVSHPRKVQSSWKPLVVYGGGPRIADVFRSTGGDNAKTLHRWGQDLDAFASVVERLTSPGQTVLDPFMGSGTTLLAAHAAGRHVIGCDLDAAAVATARERLTTG